MTPRKALLEWDCIVKIESVGDGSWHDSNLQIYEDQIEILNREFVCELVVEKQSVLAISILPAVNSSNLILNILAIPQVDNRRKYVDIKIDGEKGVVLCLEQILDRSGFRCPARRLAVFINPFAGTGRAREKWRQVANILTIAGVEFDEIVTESKNHAHEEVKKMKNLSKYDGVVTVSGDGLVHEALNGLTSRQDWQQVPAPAIGIVPGGSGNAIHCSLLYQQREHFADELLVSALNIARGLPAEGDFIECQSDTTRFSSMFGVAWGLIPDCDIGSEVIRWAGFLRAYLWLVFRIIKPRAYSGVVSYLECKQDIDDPGEDPDLPAIGDPLPSSWNSVKGRFLTVYACKQSWLDYSTLLIPQAKLNDGVIHLIMISAEVTRLEWIQYLLSPNDLELREKVKAIQIIPVSAFRFEMDGSDDPLTVDAEKLSCSTVQGRIKRRACKILLKDKL